MLVKGATDGKVKDGKVKHMPAELAHIGISWNLHQKKVHLPTYSGPRFINP